MQKLFSVKFTQRTPAGFPSGIPGIGPAIEITMQHAPHPARHSDTLLDIRNLAKKNQFQQSRYQHMHHLASANLLWVKEQSSQLSLNQAWLIS
jgi:hypothetical protein